MTKTYPEHKKNISMSANHDFLKLKPMHAPEHSVCPVLMKKPALQLLHMSVRCLVQAAPVLGEPFEQRHMLAARDTHTHVRVVRRAPS